MNYLAGFLGKMGETEQGETEQEEIEQCKQRLEIIPTLNENGQCNISEGS